MTPTIFPLHGITPDGKCKCSDAGCTRAGKHPAYPYSRLQSGERVAGPAGHGLVTGIKSGVFVVDTDGGEADARFVERWWADDNAPELDTRTHSTPSGGYHYFFEWPGFPVRTSQGELLRTPEEATAKVSSKIDIRGDVNGYVVLPGSPHVSGGEYKVVNGAPPMKAPAWLLEWAGLRGTSTSSTCSNVPVIPVDVDTDLGRERIAMGREACATMDGAVARENGSLALWQVALQLVREYELPLPTAHTLITEVYNPRCTPPWSPTEIQHKLENARDKSDRLPGVVPDDLLDGAANQPTEYTGPAIARKQHNPAHVYECDLSMTPNGARKTTQGEVLSQLYGHPAWRGVLQHDTFRDRTFAVDPPIKMPGAARGELNDADIVAVRHWFECMGQMSVSKDAAWDCVLAVAHDNSFHPLQDYLSSLAPAEGAIDELARDALGLSDEFDRMYVRRFLIGAVRRVLDPGHKMDNMLVLKGDPGLKKSTFVLALFGKDWTSENLADIGDEKKAGEVMAGKWAIEVAEMKDIMRAGNETVAAFITRTSERFRAAYARGNAIDRPRSCVLISSTNDDEFLRNATGADTRRFWIVEPKAGAAGKIDTAWIIANRDRVWGEAVALARAGERHWLEGEEEQCHRERMKPYEVKHVWHGLIEQYCIGREIIRDELEVYKGAIGGTAEKCDTKKRNDIRDSLRRLGCVWKPAPKDRSRKRVWHVPASLTNAEPSAEEKTRRETSIDLMNTN